MPDNLVLGLKRFRYETYDGGAKVNDCFDFPARIDMNSYKIQQLAHPELVTEPDVFQLVGVVVHDGTLQYGHYWSYAAERSCQDKSTMPWFRLEDGLVNNVALEEAMTETRGGFGKPDKHGQAWLRTDNAYVLFYERLSTIKSAVASFGEPLTPGSSVLGHYPRVPVPVGLAQEIAKENEKHLRLLCIFGNEYAEFVCESLERYEGVLNGQLEDEDILRSSLLELAFNHLSQVTINSQSLSHLDRLASATMKLITLHPYNAQRFLDMLFRHSNLWTFERLIFHKREAVRVHIRTLVVACLRIIREYYPRNYGANADGVLVDNPSSYIRLVTNAHTELLGRLFRARHAWPEYFKIVTEIASFGLHETALLICSGYLTWCLEVLLIKYEPSLQQKHHDLWWHMECNRSYQLHVLTSCVYRLLHEHVNLTIANYAEGTKTDLNESIPLSMDETTLINSRDFRGRSLLVQVTIQAMVEVDERSVASTELYRSLWQGLI